MIVLRYRETINLACGWMINNWLVSNLREGVTRCRVSLFLICVIAGCWHHTGEPVALWHHPSHEEILATIPSLMPELKFITSNQNLLQAIDDVNRGMRSIQSIQSYKLSVKNSHPTKLIWSQFECALAHNIEKKHFVASLRTQVSALTTILKYPIVVNILSKYLADGTSPS